jgi:hypothetical protein
MRKFCANAQNRGVCHAPSAGLAYTCRTANEMPQIACTFVHIKSSLHVWPATFARSHCTSLTSCQFAQLPLAMHGTASYADLNCRQRADAQEMKVLKLTSFNLDELLMKNAFERRAELYIRNQLMEKTHAA